VQKRKRSTLVAALACVVAVALSGCGSSSKSTSVSAGTVTLLMAGSPGSLDPGVASTPQADEPDWLAYTGLVTYAHASGLAGTRLIPGLATTLPVIGEGGRSYTAVLRKKLVFSNGGRVQASDFAYTVERAIRIPGGAAAQFITEEIKGASAYARGQAKTISGITTNNATGRIVIHLNSPDGAFANVLALPALGIISPRTPFRNKPNSPPPGVGPYEITNIVPNASFSLVQNPYWGQLNIPQIPAGHVNVNVRISPKPEADALAVLKNSADVLDWTDQIPGDLLRTIRARAADRYASEVMTSTEYVFFNTRTRPFANLLAREAVVTGLNQNVISRLASGSLSPGCYLVPSTVIEWPAGPCPYANPSGGGDIAQARILVRRSGMAGTPVTVWSEAEAPSRQWMAYYTSLLNRIGFKATEKVISNTAYLTALGNPSLEPQTGFAERSLGFPDASGLYSLLKNSGEVNLKPLDAELSNLEAVPTSDANAVADQWRSLMEYVAKKAYVGVLGYPTFPAFTSTAIKRSALVFNPVYGWDWSSFDPK
jgi:peptide/nickel transport system substrate-binding protein